MEWKDKPIIADGTICISCLIIFPVTINTSVCSIVEECKRDQHHKYGRLHKAKQTACGYALKDQLYLNVHLVIRLSVFW